MHHLKYATIKNNYVNLYTDIRNFWVLLLKEKSSCRHYDYIYVKNIPSKLTFSLYIPQIQLCSLTISYKYNKSTVHFLTQQVLSKMNVVGHAFNLGGWELWEAEAGEWKVRAYPGQLSNFTWCGLNFYK